MTTLLIVFRGIMCGLAAITALYAQPVATEVVLHNFAAPFPKGQDPSGVVRDRSGNLYGTSSSGGEWGHGEVFTLNASGETVLYSFTGGADGSSPEEGVVGDGAGNLYGTTQSGGAFNAGVVYKVDANGSETVLYSFTGGGDGSAPNGDLVRDADGNFYGTTQSGGTSCLGLEPVIKCGVIYKLDASGQESVLFSFTEFSGFQTYTGVIRDSAGNLYGTTRNGGDFQEGVVYELDTSNQFTVLFAFSPPESGSTGFVPSTGLARDSNGNLYGATAENGESASTVYEVSPAGVETVLHSFSSNEQSSNVSLDAAGNVYGTIFTAQSTGFVYKLTPSGQYTVLYTFNTGLPSSGVIVDGSGDLYGTAIGGKAGGGFIYKINAAGEQDILYSFPGALGGATPLAGLTRDSAGNIYGTTSTGGADGAGVVYKLDTAGKETVLYRFTGGADGAYPQAAVVRDAAGNLYGTTLSGGESGSCLSCGNPGVAFKVDPAGHETVLHNFTGGADGESPYSGLTFDASGNLFGTTYYGGANDFGVVYKIDPAGNETVVYSFGSGGATPRAGVIFDEAGNLYGTASQGGTASGGTVYKLDPHGNESVLHSFLGGTDGSYPYAGVIRDAAGNLYGTTSAGGGSEAGVVYEVDAAGNESVLYTFSGGADGAQPYAGVIRDPATGNLFGTTQGGGAKGKGVVYKLDASGTETVLYSFSGTDGASPAAGLIFDAAGNLYGTTSQGGTKPGGVVFEIKAAAGAQ